MRERSDKATTTYKPNGKAPAEPVLSSDVALFNPWSEYIVPTFPLDVLPPVAQDYVITQSVLMGCCPSALAMSVLVTFSAALDHASRSR